MEEITNLKDYDNGGAEAIKGFNFQKANLIMLAINNYQKRGFKIYIETEDDIVVSYESYRAFIQVKKQKHTFNSITKKERKVITDSSGKKSTEFKTSILEKNLKAGTEDDTFKIIVKDIGESDKKKLNIKRPGSICAELHELNDEGKKVIVQALPSDLVKRLDNFYFFISPIHEDLIEAEKYLIGCLSGVNVSVDNKRGRAIIAELSLTIDQKAEEVLIGAVDKEIKSMDADYLSKILITCKRLNDFDAVLNSLGYNELSKKQIKSERLKIELNKSNLKEDMKQVLTEWIGNNGDFEKVPNKEIINFLVDKFNSIEVNNKTLISVAIESVCELGDELFDY